MVDHPFLAHMLTGRVVVACVGNTWRADDGVGPLIGSFLKATGRVKVIDCGETPENYLGVIARMKPEKVVVIDAADFGGRPGEVRIVARADIACGGLATRAARLTTFTDYIEAQTGAKTFFLAIQPESLEFGKPLSEVVAGAGRDLAEAINSAIRESPWEAAAG